MKKLFISAVMILGIVCTTSSCVRNENTEGTVISDSLAVDSLAVADSLKATNDTTSGKSIR